MTQLQASPHRLAVVLFSGGLDSTTLIAMARAQGYRVLALSFRYGQRQAVELSVAARGARAWGCEAHRVIDIDLAVFGGSALTDHSLAVPKDAHTKQIPITYVPARNTIFLSYALAWAEVVGASDIFIGVNAVDYSGYPDCRPQFIEAYQQLANVATAAESRGRPAYQIHAPLLHLSKAEIIEKGIALGVDYAETHSCYDPDSSGAACARCDACRLRRAGFMAAGVPDPTRYAASA